MYGSSFEPRSGRGFGRIASGVLKACPCVGRGTAAPCSGLCPGHRLYPG